MRGLLCFTVALAAGALAVPNASDVRCKSMDTACEDFVRAAQCGTTKQCVPRWEKMRTPHGNDTELCAMCKKMVQEAKDTLMSNETQLELRQVLEGSCDVLVPVRSFAGLCKKLMDTFQDELDDILVSRMDPAQVCQVSGLCWKTADSNIVERAGELALHRKEQKTCNNCKHSVDAVSGFMRLFRDTELTSAFSKACQREGFDESQCNQFAQTYVTKFVQQFKSVPAEKSCRFFGSCGNSPKSMTVGVRDNLQCEFCEAMIHKVVVQFNNTSMKTQVKTVLENICKKTGSYAQECQEKINNDFDKAYDELLSLMDPFRVCDGIGLCNNNSARTMMPMAKLTPASRMAPSVEARASTKVCDGCQNIAGYLVAAVQNNRSEEHVKAVLEKTCELIPTDVASCQQFIDEHMDALYDLLRKDVTVDNICKSLHLCSKRPVVRVPKNSNCITCTLIAGYLVDELKDNKTDAAIITAMEKVCKYVPVDATTCKSAIDTYGAEIVEMIQKDVTAAEICQKLGFCTAAIAPLKSRKMPEDNCALCGVIANFLANELKDNKTEAAVIKALEKVCSVVPVESAKCKNAVDVYGNLIIQMIQNNVSADEICKAIGLCSAALVKSVTNDKCTICTIVSDFLVDQLKDNKTDAAIISALEKVCTMAPADDFTTCKNTVDVYGAIIIQMIQNNVDPAQICKEIGLCGAPKRLQAVSDTCSTCSMTAEILISWEKDDKTDDATIVSLEKVCNDLFLDKTECTNMIKAHGDQMITLIEQNVDAAGICKAIASCSPGKPKKTISDESCVLCKTVAIYVIDELKDNKNEQAIKTALEKVCNYVPADSVAKCEQMVEQYTDKIVQLIIEEAKPDEICSAIRLCPQQSRKVTGFVCNICQTLAQKAIDFVKAQKTEDEILTELEKVCNVIPTDTIQCKNIVDIYADKIIRFAIQNWPAEQICAEIGLCAKQVQDNQFCPFCQIIVHVVEAELQNNSTMKMIEGALDKACAALPQNDQVTCKNMVNVYTGYIIEMIESLASPEQICQTLRFCPTPPSDTKCEVCMFITNYVESQLSDNRTEAEIQALLDKVCDHIPNMNVQQCKDTINQASDMIISLLTQMVPPRKICEEIKLCPTIVVKKIRKPKDEVCSFCKWLVTVVDNKLQDERTEGIIKEELDKACDLLADADKCKTMVNDYVDMIVKMLIQYADPEKICEAMGKCPSKQYVQRNEEPPCRYCTFIIDQLRGDLLRSEAVLKAKLDGICSIIGNPLGCVSFVDKYADHIVRMILDRTDPELICEKLWVCPRSKLAQVGKCDYCTEIMGFITAEVKDESTDADIIAVVEKVCDLVPTVYREDCQRMVEVQGMVIVRMIAQSIDAESICETIKFCPKTKHGDSIVCTWCEYALHYIQNKLYDNATEQALDAEMKRMCAELPSAEMKTECKEFVDKYAPALEVLIAQRLDPSILCPAVGACPSKRILHNSATSNCQRCIGSIRTYRGNPTGICRGTNAQFKDKCNYAAKIGVNLLNGFESDFKLCKIAKSCFDISGSFSCNRGGCKQLN